MVDRCGILVNENGESVVFLLAEAPVEIGSVQLSGSSVTVADHVGSAVASFDIGAVLREAVKNPGHVHVAVIIADGGKEFWENVPIVIENM